MNRQTPNNGSSTPQSLYSRTQSLIRQATSELNLTLNNQSSPRPSTSVAVALGYSGPASGESAKTTKKDPTLTGSRWQVQEN